ncbi:MAG: histidinol-phosphatase HisJ family protein [Clostridia bacterium]|nr:histidinol-phosphatase HisJ family protein [Clostridia bacterium]
MIAVDTHTHSTCSHDGKSTLWEMAEAAISRGMTHLYLTEHADTNFDKEGNPYTNFMGKTMMEARESLPAGIRMPLSIEFGQATAFPAIAERILSMQDYEYVIGSLHRLSGNFSMIYHEYSDRADCEAVLRRYMSELTAFAAEAEYDTLGHIDYPLRYFYVSCGEILELEDFPEELDETLRIVISRGKSLELNTATLRKGYPRLMEGAIHRYRELGGTLVTVGSDAHSTGDLQSDFDQAEDILRRAGFDSYTIYEHRTPILVPFEPKGNPV